MPGAPGTTIILTPSGQLTFSASKRFRYDLTQLASLADFSGKQPYLRQMIMALDLNVTNGSGQPQVLNWQKLYDVIKRVSFYIQGHSFLDFPSTGGQSIRYMNFLLTGKKPELSTDQTVPGAATVTIPLKFIIPCYDPRSVSSEDDLLPLGLLSGAGVEFDFCSAVELGANFTINVATAPRVMTAEIILRDELRFPALWTWQERVQNSLSDKIDPAKVLLTDILLENILPAGQSFTGLSTANVTSIQLTENGLKTWDSIQIQDIVSCYNAQQPQSSEGYFTQPENGTLDGLPLKWNPRSSGKRTHMTPALNSPYLKITGNLSAANAQLLLHYYNPIGPATVADICSKMGIALPAAFKTAPQSVLAAKSPTKQPIRSDKSAFLPQKLYRNGVPGIAKASK